MPPFDARREPFRIAPTLAMMTVAACAGAVTVAAKAQSEGKAKEAVVKSDTAKADKPTVGKSGKVAIGKAGAKAAKPAAEPDTSAKDKPGEGKLAKGEDAKGKDKVKVKVAKGEDAKAAKSAAKPDAKEAKTAKAADKTAEKTATASKAKPAEKIETAKAPPEAKLKGKLAVKADEAAKPAAAGPKYGAAQTIKVKLRKGETLEAAIRRAEAAPDDAKTAAVALEKALGKAPAAGQLFAVEVAPREGRVGAGKLMKLTIKSGAAFDPVVLGRSNKGELTLASRTKLAAAKAAKVKAAGDEGDATSSGKIERAKLITGEVRGSLFGSARKAGVGNGQIGEIVKAFAAKVDFQRDLKVGDKFTVVYDDDGKLLYAKIKAKGSYRFARQGGEVLWLDDDGKSLKSGLLRTPVDGARMSSRFGLRIHPILGYAKMHQGIDFAAASGTPIMAAGDGEVVEIRRWGGYGNWLRIKHKGGFESGYAHLSRYASGLQVGDKVKQGQLVAYVGSTGASTGPHLHHEIWLNGKRVDPKGARIPTGFALEGKELIAFKAQQAKVAAALGDGDRKFARGKDKTKVAGLRPAKSADGAA